MIDHIIVGVDDLEACSAFYEQALAALGMGVVMAMPHGVGYGKDGKPAFWIADRELSGPVHVAFTESRRATVDAFYAAALAAGGHDNGRPGLRPHYHPSLLRRVRLRPGRQQHRGGLPPTRVGGLPGEGASPGRVAMGQAAGGRSARLNRGRDGSGRRRRATRPRGQVTTSSPLPQATASVSRSPSAPSTRAREPISWTGPRSSERSSASR